MPARVVSPDHAWRVYQGQKNVSCIFAQERHALHCVGSVKSICFAWKSFIKRCVGVIYLEIELQSSSGQLSDRQNLRLQEEVMDTTNSHKQYQRCAQGDLSSTRKPHTSKPRQAPQQAVVAVPGQAHQHMCAPDAFNSSIYLLLTPYRIRALLGSPAAAAFSAQVLAPPPTTPEGCSAQQPLAQPHRPRRRVM